MRREERELTRLARRYGLTLERARKHFRLVDERGAVAAVASSTASDWRTVRNLESRLRRMGK